MNTLYVVMPAYNEEANIAETVRSWYPVLEGKSEDSRLVIADSGSSDRTHEILEELQSEFPKLEILTDSDRQHGPKLIALYGYAISKGADYIFQTDSDGQTDPNEFGAFWDARAMVEKVVCLLLRLYFRVKVPDANAPFRLMKSDVVAKYLGRLPEDYNIPNIMLTTYFVHYKENVEFRVITFKPRQGGKNSINIRKIFKIGRKALKDFRHFKKEM